MTLTARMKCYAIIILLLLLLVLVGCSIVDPPAQVMMPTNGSTAQTEPTAEATTQGTEVTRPTDVQVPPATTPPPATEGQMKETKPTHPPAATVPETKPTEPSETIPPETRPAETTPPETKPTEAVPPTTQPPAPQPTVPTTEPPHQHSYTGKVVEPDCSNGGYTVFTCDCGSSYTAEETAVLGHAYTDTVTTPSFWKQGYTTHRCDRCGDSFTDSYCNMPAEDKETFIAEVQAVTAKYINQYRLADGNTEATILPRLTEVAEYRATLLHKDFSHSTRVLREVLALYEYGQYVTPGGWDPSEYYYYFPGQEAISRTSKTGTADEIGKQFAQNFRNSSGHWRYVGDSKYSFLAVGISYDPSAPAGCYWTCCVFVSTTDQYG